MTGPSPGDPPGHLRLSGPHALDPDFIHTWLTVLPGEDARARAWALLSIQDALDATREGLSEYRPRDARRTAHRHLRRRWNREWTAAIEQLPPRERATFTRLRLARHQLGGLCLTPTTGLLTLAGVLLSHAEQDGGVTFALSLLASLILNHLFLRRAQQDARQFGGSFRPRGPTWSAWSPATTRSLQRALTLYTSRARTDLYTEEHDTAQPR